MDIILLMMCLLADEAFFYCFFALLCYNIAKLRDGIMFKDKEKIVIAGKSFDYDVLTFFIK